MVALARKTGRRELARSTGWGVALAAALVFCSVAHAQNKPASDWPQPDVSKLPQGAWKDAVLYGQKLIVETYSVVGPEVSNKSMRYAGNNLSCQSCHLDGGRQQFGLPLIGVFGVYPAYMG